MSDAGTLSFSSDDQRASRLFVAPYLVQLLSADRLDLPSVRRSIAEVSTVRLGRGEPGHERTVIDGGRVLSVCVPDGWMSTRHAELRCDDSSWILYDLGSKNGTFVGGRPIEEQRLVDGDIVETGNTFFLFRDRVQRSYREPADLEASSGDIEPALSTLSPSLARAVSDLRQISRSEVAVLLLGETGTGKEVTARMIHRESGRDGPLIAVNCGALPPTLIESELFGHRKGAFSGATSDRVGLVQSADGGTLFLDEIAELPIEQQAVLLRVLQEREVTPVGATRPVPVNVRVVAATHGDLRARVEDGRFRADLYARLAGHCAELPPLRERREDLGILIGRFLRRGDPDGSAHLDRSAIRALCLHSWPHNIRELEQVLFRAVALGGERIRREHLPEAIAALGAPAAAQHSSPDDGLREELVGFLTRHQGNVSAVAREMGKARVQIRRWCKRYGLDPAAFRSS